MLSIDEGGALLSSLPSVCVCVRLGACAHARVCERQAPLSVPSHMDVGVNGECPTLPPPLFASHIHMHEADVHVYVCARAGEGWEGGAGGLEREREREGGLLITRFPS